MIEPVNGRILVELRGKYKNITGATQQFGDSKTRGIVRAIAADITPAKLQEIGAAKLKVGDWIYFGAYEDTAKYPVDGKDHILIKLEDVGGREDADAAA